jgi:hypothetical protein
VSSISTRPADVPLDELVRARRIRRFGLAILGVVVVAGLFNLLGIRREVVVAEGAGYRLDVRYARVTRPGLATTWEVAVTHPGGFDGPITIATNADYFDRFDFNQFYPEPSTTAARGDVVLLTFEDIEGERFILRFDGRATPTFAFDPAEATTTLEVRGREVARVDYTTVVMP